MDMDADMDRLLVLVGMGFSKPMGMDTDTTPCV